MTVLTVLTVPNDPPPDVTLDITSDVCPLTFVRTKLMIERMESGQVAEVRLNDGEPLGNVPRSVEEHGHAILSLEPEAEGSPVWRLVLRKS
ncbi:MAG: sulfurtransferase TusA family protein [Rhodospirillales bacterium]|nr:sulfurtransferase TusA family protein [Rhodospirillales bacterium]